MSIVNSTRSAGFSAPAVIHASRTASAIKLVRPRESIQESRVIAALVTRCAYTTGPPHEGTELIDIERAPVTYREARGIIDKEGPSPLFVFSQARGGEEGATARWRLLVAVARSINDLAKVNAS